MIGDWSDRDDGGGEGRGDPEGGREHDRAAHDGEPSPEPDGLNVPDRQDGPEGPRGPGREGGVSVVVAAGPAPWGALARERLQAEPDLALAGEAADAGEALFLVRTRQPAVVLFDAGLPQGDPLALVHALREAHPPARVLAVAGTPAPGTLAAVEVVRRGGHGLLHAESVPRLVGKAVRCVAGGQAWLSRAEETQVLEALWALSEGSAPVVACRAEAVESPPEAGRDSRDVERGPRAADGI